jgi:hypothetical protein
MADEGKANVMKDIKVEKLVLNCCVGESGDRSTRAARVLEQLTGQTTGSTPRPVTRSVHSESDVTRRLPFMSLSAVRRLWKFLSVD